MLKLAKVARAFAAAAVLAGPWGSSTALAETWEPTKPVELIVPAGAGGGADQMARFIQGVVAKHALMKQPLIVVNKPGGAGAEGFLQIKGAAKDPHKIVITLSNLFTTPLGTGVPFNWTDLTPVQMLALDQFILWVHADSELRSPKQYIDAIRSGADKQFKMGGTGSKQEDQIITGALERVAASRKLTYVPFKGGGEVAIQLVGRHIDSTVNNPIEAVEHWKSGKLRPLCIFDAKRSTYTAKITKDMAWSDIPTCKESGIDVEYQMLRGIFAAPGISKEQTAFYVALLDKVAATPDWQKFMEAGAFNPTRMHGEQFVHWLESAERTHRELMTEADFIGRN